MASVEEEAAVAAARQLAQSCAAVLGAPVRSAILHGSLTLDDFVPGASDLDLILVVDHALPGGGAAALETAVRAADTATASGIDLLVVTADVAAAPTRTPRLEYGIGLYPGPPGEVEVEVEAGVDPCPDLLAELSMARSDGRSLLGAAPHEVIGEVPHEWLREQGLHWITVWQTRPDDADHDAFMVLTACRMWRFAVEGTHCSKAQAATWALEQDPSQTAIRQALRRRRGESAADTPITVDGVRAVLEAAHRGISATFPPAD
jgi:Domain of unknown function (DUF4111)